MTDTVTAHPRFGKKHLSIEIIVPPGVKRLNYQTGQYQTSELAGQRISLKGYRVTCQIENVGQSQGNAAGIQVYNLPPDLMKSLTGFGTLSVFNYVASGNDSQELGATVQVQIFTSNDTTDTLSNTDDQQDNQRNMVFWGSLQTCQAVMQATPDPFVQMQCRTLGFAQFSPASVISIKGATKAADIAQNIGNTMGLAFENNGVNTVLQNPYFYGSAMQQLQDLSQQALFNYTASNGVLSIWPIGGQRNPSSKSVTLINADSGMIGYPDFAGVSVTFRTLYNPSIRFGDQIRIESIVPNVTGDYTVNRTAHHLSADVPGGPWETEVLATFFRNPIGTAGV